MEKPAGVDVALDVLYGVPLEAFVNERKRLAQELRRGGDKSAATEIAKWRKPSAAAWALNRVARETPDVVAEWLATAADLRDASARPTEVGGEVVRSAIAAHRSATSRLLEFVRNRARPGGRQLSEDMLDRARTLLQTATTDEGVAELLRRGRVDEGALPPPDAQMDTESPAAPAARATTGKRDSEAEQRAAAVAQREREARERAERTAELKRRIAEAESEADALATEYGVRSAAADRSRERVRVARRAMQQAEEEAGAAQAAVGELDAPLRAAQDVVHRLRAQFGVLDD